MLNLIIKKILTMLVYGIVWLFIFSCPMGQGRVFDWGYSHIVDTAPVRWVINKLPFKKSHSNASMDAKPAASHKH